MPISALAQLSAWCATRFGPHTLESDSGPSAFGVPWVARVGRAARDRWGWRLQTYLATIPEAIAHRAVQNPDRLESTQG
jgi:CDP-paratose 2-epimerase